MAKNVIIGQSGGPTAVINSSLAGVYKAAISLGAEKVYGMQYGIEGLLKEEMLELNVLLNDRMSIELLKRTPSSYLGSCRYKLPDPDVDATPFVKLFTLFDKYDICAVFYIGGNDSMDTIAKLSRYGARVGSRGAVHRCAQDHRQRPVPDRPHPRLRLGSQVHCHHPEGSHPGLLRLRHPQRDRGRDHGPPRGLAGRCGLPGRRRRLRRPGPHPAAGSSL